MTGYFPYISEEPDALLKEIESGKRRRPDGVSELAKDFLNIVLDPLNSKEITARSLLGHPWLAPVAPKLPPQPDYEVLKTRIPHLPSAAHDRDVENATRDAERWAEKLVPFYLDELSRRLEKNGEIKVGTLSQVNGTSTETKNEGTKWGKLGVGKLLEKLRRMSS